MGELKKEKHHPKKAKVSPNKTIAMKSQIWKISHLVCFTELVANEDESSEDSVVENAPLLSVLAHPRAHGAH